MQKILIIILILLPFASFGQHYKKCKIFQYSGIDSLNGKLFSEESYNTKGLRTTFYRCGDKMTLSFIYKDTILVSSTSIDELGDSSKTVYYYNASGQKIKEKDFDYTRRLKRNSNKWSCIVSDDDYEKKRTWKMTSWAKFKYDLNGNKIRYDTREPHSSSHEKYTWTYDEKDRIISHSLFNNNTVIWTERYEYLDGGYKFTRTWYDGNGNPQHLKDKRLGYWPQYTFAYKLNDKGQEVEERVTNEKEELISRTATFYNEWSKVIKRTNFDSKGNVGITNIYLYE